MTPTPAWNRTTARSHTAFSVSRISRLSFTFFFCWQWVSLLPVTPALMQSHLLIEWPSILIHNCLSISKFIDFSLFRSLGNSVSLWHICLGPSTMIMSIYSLFSFFFGCLSFGIKIWTIWTICHLTSTSVSIITWENIFMHKISFKILNGVIVNFVQHVCVCVYTSLYWYTNRVSHFPEGNMNYTPFYHDRALRFLSFSRNH